MKYDCPCKNANRYPCNVFPVIILPQVPTAVRNNDAMIIVIFFLASFVTLDSQQQKQYSVKVPTEKLKECVKGV